MGLAIIDLAKNCNQKIAIEICRLNHSIFYISMIVFRLINTIGSKEKQIVITIYLLRYRHQIL